MHISCPLVICMPDMKSENSVVAKGGHFDWYFLQSPPATFLFRFLNENTFSYLLSGYFSQRQAKLEVVKIRVFPTGLKVHLVFKNFAFLEHLHNSVIIKKIWWPFFALYQNLGKAKHWKKKLKIILLWGLSKVYQ